MLLRPLPELPEALLHFRKRFSLWRRNSKRSCRNCRRNDCLINKHGVHIHESREQVQREVKAVNRSNAK